jgi:hypothetical protein
MLPYTIKGRGLDLGGNQLHNYPELSRAHEYDLVSVVVHVGSIDTGMTSLCNCCLSGTLC